MVQRPWSSRFSMPNHHIENLKEDLKMFDPKSDYALNKKDPEAIVYHSATGVHIRLTRENFASEEEFRLWKDFSDDDYRDIENAGRTYRNNCVPLTDSLESSAPSA